MDISVADLEASYRRAWAAWPEIVGIEARYGLPDHLLFAVGSRETNLTDEIGDAGHGHGIFQLDDRSHQIPSPFPPWLQAQTAAEELVGWYGRFGDWRAALNGYNSGQSGDAGTAHGDYGLDVLARAAVLLRIFRERTRMDSVAYDPATGGTWTVNARGQVYAADGAAFHGGLDSHPEWGAGTAYNPAIGIAPHSGGYVIVTRDSRDTSGDPYRYYRLPL